MTISDCIIFSNRYINVAEFCCPDFTAFKKVFRMVLLMARVVH